MVIVNRQSAFRIRKWLSFLSVFRIYIFLASVPDFIAVSTPAVTSNALNILILMRYYIEKLCLSGCNVFSYISTSYPIYALFYRKRVTINLLTCASFRLYSVKNKACTIELICNRFDIFGCQKLATDYTKTFISVCTLWMTRHPDFQIALLCFQVVFTFSGSVTSAVRLLMLCAYVLRFCPPHHGAVFVFAM